MNDDDLRTFESQRPHLLALAYRMLGELGRAEDIVQDAWLRWRSRRDAEVDAPHAYLTKTVMRLCLTELDSARARREEARSDRLPEPALLADPEPPAHTLDRVSMALLVLLQRLTPAERAVLLLRDVFDFSHAEIADLVEKSEPACRQLLKRARTHVASERRALEVSEEVHRRLLEAFVDAAANGDTEAVLRLLVDDAVLIADAGPHGGTFGRVKNLPGPLVGARRVAAFAAAITPQGSPGLGVRLCRLNGEPAIVVTRSGVAFATIMISVTGDRIRGIFIQADPAKLRGLDVSRVPQ